MAGALYSMDEKRQIKAFAEDIERLVDRYRNEFDLSYASVVGTLHMQASTLCLESQEEAASDE